MGEQQELDSLGEIFEVVRQMAGFTGDIVMQYASGRAYREQKGVEAVASHIRSGGRADSTLIRIEAAGEFEKRLMGARIPFAGFEITSERDEKMMVYAFRDKDRAVVRDVIRDMEIGLDRKTTEQPGRLDHNPEKRRELEPSL